ncbi:MAG: putative nodulation protein [Solirubrobacterales bacterium]|nr:putative nodulation protein [Solirubrobacterales bacterium]
MHALLPVARSIRDTVRRARFELWVARLRAELAARGARLVLDAPHGLAFDEMPALRIERFGEGDGTLTLRIGEHVRFGRRVTLEVWAGGTNVLELGERSFVLDDAQLSLRGGALRLGPHASIRTRCLVKTAGEARFGRYAGLSTGSVMHCAEEIVFEDYAGTAERATVVDSSKAIDGGDTYFLDQPLLTAPIHIGRNTFIAANVVITAGTRIGANAVVGANSVLSGKEYPGGWIIAGAPAKPVKPLPLTAGRDAPAPA